MVSWAGTDALTRVLVRVLTGGVGYGCGHRRSSGTCRRRGSRRWRCSLSRTRRPASTSPSSAATSRCAPHLPRTRCSASCRRHWDVRHASLRESREMQDG
eukprot:219256-Rhodomonas_salina.1